MYLYYLFYYFRESWLAQHTHTHTPPRPDKGKTTLGLLPQKEGEMVPQAVSLPLPQAARVTVLCVWQCVPFGAYSHQGPAHPATFPGSLAPLLAPELQGFHLHPGGYFSSSRLCPTCERAFCADLLEEKNLRKILLGFILRASRCLSLTRRPGHVLWCQDNNYYNGILN